MSEETETSVRDSIDSRLRWQHARWLLNNDDFRNSFGNWIRGPARKVRQFAIVVQKPLLAILASRIIRVMVLLLGWTITCGVIIGLIFVVGLGASKVFGVLIPDPHWQSADMNRWSAILTWALAMYWIACGRWLHLPVRRPLDRPLKPRSKTIDRPFARYFVVSKWMFVAVLPIVFVNALLIQSASVSTGSMVLANGANVLLTISVFRLAGRIGILLARIGPQRTVESQFRVGRVVNFAKLLLLASIWCIPLLLLFELPERWLFPLAEFTFRPMLDVLTDIAAGNFASLIWAACLICGFLVAERIVALFISPWRFRVALANRIRAIEIAPNLETDESEPVASAHDHFSKAERFLQNELRCSTLTVRLRSPMQWVFPKWLRQFGIWVFVPLGVFLVIGVLSAAKILSESDATQLMADDHFVTVAHNLLLVCFAVYVFSLELSYLMHSFRCITLVFEHRPISFWSLWKETHIEGLQRLVTVTIFSLPFVMLLEHLFGGIATPLRVLAFVFVGIITIRNFVVFLVGIHPFEMEMGRFGLLILPAAAFILINTFIAFISAVAGAVVHAPNQAVALSAISLAASFLLPLVCVILRWHFEKESPSKTHRVTQPEAHSIG